jgi:hypothetical protein
MSVTSQLLVTTTVLPGAAVEVPPWQPRQWTNENLPDALHIVTSLSGEPVIPLADLAFLLNASPQDLLKWRHRRGFPIERIYDFQPDAVGYNPDELIVFLKTLPHADQARVCPLLPLGSANALDTVDSVHMMTFDWKLPRLPLDATLKEVTVALAVMLATVAVCLFGMIAALR